MIGIFRYSNDAVYLFSSLLSSFHLRRQIKTFCCDKPIANMTGTGTDIDQTSALPDELILSVFKFLPLESLLQCEHVCRRWGKLARDGSLWREIPIVYSGKPGQTEVSEKNLEILRTHCENISCVKVQYLYNYSFILSVLEKCTNLTSIELVMCRVTTDFSEDILMWPRLKKLNLKNSLLLQTKETGPEMLIQFDRFKDLLFLSLADFGLSSLNIKTLINCTHLCHIFVEKIVDLNPDDLKELVLAKQKILISLHVHGGAAIDDKCLHLLAQCQHLKDLAIIRCESLTDKGLLPLACLRHLEHLQMWNNINFSEMALLSTLGSPNLKQLGSLSLSRIANISPVIVDLISEHYKNLKFLALYQCPRIINSDYEKQLKSKFRNIDVVLY